LKRHQKAVQSKTKHLPSPTAVVQLIAAGMAEHGPTLRTDLEAAVAPNTVNSGHIVDALMTVTAEWSGQLERGETEAAFKSTVGILWLARALAHAQGKLQEKPAAQA
jgi:hypothetical protein